MDPLNGMFGNTINAPWESRVHSWNRVSVAERNQKTWLHDDLSDLQGQRATEATHSPEAVNNWARQGLEMGVVS